MKMQRILALAAVIVPVTAGAQRLTAHRQFLAVEPYYSRLWLDAGANTSRIGLNAYGARLWVNMAPFGASRHLGLGLFTTYAPEQDNRQFSIVHYGGQLEIFALNRPAGGVFDPFVTLGGGAFRTNSGGGSQTRFALTPGGGFRIPIPNRFQLRIDARDIVRFNVPNGTAATRTANNLELQAALGLTF